MTWALEDADLEPDDIDYINSHGPATIINDPTETKAIKTVFDEYADKHGLEEIADIFGRGVKIEVGDMLASGAYAERLQRVPPAWEKAFEINVSKDSAMRAACVEFVLAGLYAHEKISRSSRHGILTYET